MLRNEIHENKQKENFFVNAHRGIVVPAYMVCTSTKMIFLVFMTGGVSIKKLSFIDIFDEYNFTIRKTRVYSCIDSSNLDIIPYHRVILNDNIYVERL